MQTVIIGNGYMGRKFKERLPEALITSTDITDKDALRVLLAPRPEFVINCAAKTGGVNTIDWCESHKEETHASNVKGPITLAEVCEEEKINLVHLGTGYIYNGDCNGEGYSETDRPNFTQGYYVKTKLECERKLSKMEGSILQLRLMPPLDNIPHERNLITKLVKYRRALNVPSSVSIIDDFIAAALFLMEERATGLYNVANQGVISPAQILGMYKEIVDPSYEFEVISPKDLGTKAARPSCVLNVDRLCLFFDMPDIQESLDTTLRIYKRKLTST